MCIYTITGNLNIISILFYHSTLIFTTFQLFTYLYSCFMHSFSIVQRFEHFDVIALYRATERAWFILVMLDLSSAFDTIEHEVLLTRLEHTFGITDKALAWLRSYLSERHHNVVVDSTMSTNYVLQCGVPQGSVLGPVLYCMYTRPVCDIVARHGMQYH